MTARRKPARRRSSHLVLVQTLPTRPPLHRRLLRMLSASGIAVACSLALLAIVAIYAMWPSDPHRPAEAAAQPRASARENGTPVERAQELASTQRHMLMARVY